MEALEGISVLIQLLSDNPSRTSISGEKMTFLVAEILRQASEQLDSVRKKAGDCLDHILVSTYLATRVDGYQTLLQALRLDAPIHDQHRPWGEPSFSFPLVLRAASVGVDENFSQVVAGLAMSVGGLTKSVCEASTTALVKWLDDVEETDFPTKLARALLDLLTRSSCNIRVSLPTIRTLQTLFRNKFLRRLPSNEQAEVFERCVRAFLETERNSDDVHRLHALVDATASLLEDVAALEERSAVDRSSGLAFLCRMLSHKYPRVRTYTAEQLYVLLLDDRGDDSSSQSLIDLILETPWASTSDEGMSGPSHRLAVGLGVQTVWESMRSSQPRVSVR
jgi:Tubulin folding cofactor D C terminal